MSTIKESLGKAVKAVKAKVEVKVEESAILKSIRKHNNVAGSRFRKEAHRASRKNAAPWRSEKSDV